MQLLGDTLRVMKQSIDLKAFRSAHGLSQSQLARLLGVDVMTVSRLERGTGSLGQPTVWRWALSALSDALQSGSTEPAPMYPGAKRDDRAERVAMVRAMLAEHPGIDLAGLAKVWKAETGEQRSISYFSRLLKTNGFVKEGDRWMRKEPPDEAAS